MKTFIKTILYSTIVALIGLLISCRAHFYQEPALNPNSPKPGVANFSKYVAIGAAIEAGYADGALYTEAQNAAYPNLIAQSIQSVNPSLVFNQPTINSVNGYSSGSVGRYLFQIPTCTTQNFNRVQQPGNAITDYTGDKSLLTNFGIPCLTLGNLNNPFVGTPATTAAGTDPRWYYHRLTNTNQVVSSLAKQAKPTFFTIWIGYTEYLNYVQTGGTSTLPSGSVNDIALLLDSLLATGATGVIGLIPDVTLFPLATNNNRRFTKSTDPIVNLPISTSTTYGASLKPYVFTSADSINFNTSLATYGAFDNNGKPYIFHSKLDTGYAFVASNGKIRRLNVNATTDALNNLLTGKTPNDLVVLSSSQLDAIGIGNVNYQCSSNSRTLLGLSKPIPSSGVLDKDEIALVRSSITSFNNNLIALVKSINTNGTRVGIVPLDDFFKELIQNGVTATQSSYSTSALPVFTTDIIYANQPQLGPDFGGFYSLDRTYPTPRGQAVLANQFIKAINSTFGASLPLLDPFQYRGNTIPGGN